MRHNWTSRAGLAVCTGLITAATAWATPAQADPLDDSFLSSLDNAGVSYDDPGSTAGLGRSICPMLTQPGETLASAASKITGSNGISPLMSDMVVSTAVSTFCPEIMSSVADGQMPDLPQLPGLPGIPGLPAGL